MIKFDAPCSCTLRARRIAPVHLPRLLESSSCEAISAALRFAPLGSIYDIQRAVADEATKPIYYKSRIAKPALNAAELPKLDADFEEIIRQSRDEEEMKFRQKMMTKWAALAALVGDPEHLALIAADLVTHLTLSPPAQSGCAQRFALPVSLSPLAECCSRSAWRRCRGWSPRRGEGM